jgi:hypothetical protein
MLVMTKKIFKYEDNGSDSNKKSLEDFLNESKASENPFDYSVIASDQSASGIVARINSEGGGSDTDKEIFQKWQGQYDACEGGCPCPGMSGATCAMFDARNDNPDDCTQDYDCQGVCGGGAIEDWNGDCCLESNTGCDGSCFTPKTAAESCPGKLVVARLYPDKVVCEELDPDNCFTCNSGEYASISACTAAYKDDGRDVSSMPF